MPPLRAKERAQLPDSAFAYIDSSGKRRLPINDASHVRNALSRFNQVAFEDEEARDRARSRLLRAAQKHGIMPIGFISAQLQPQRRLPDGPGHVPADRHRGLDRAARAARRRLRRRCSPTSAAWCARAVRRAGGHEVSARGDDVFAVFEHAPAALEAALAIQRAMRDGAWPDGSTVRLRIGLHRGRPALTETGLRRALGPRGRAHLLRGARRPDRPVRRGPRARSVEVAAGRTSRCRASARGGSAACPSRWRSSRPRRPTSPADFPPLRSAIPVEPAA